eukprot:COSAG01_NODE_4023_length_5426_cov_7.423503_2_plen_182_part_00
MLRSILRCVRCAFSLPQIHNHTINASAARHASPPPPPPPPPPPSMQPGCGTSYHVFLPRPSRRHINVSSCFRSVNFRTCTSQPCSSSASHVWHAMRGAAAPPARGAPRCWPAGPAAGCTPRLPRTPADGNTGPESAGRCHLDPRATAPDVFRQQGPARAAVSSANFRFVGWGAQWQERDTD